MFGFAFGELIAESGGGGSAQPLERNPLGRLRTKGAYYSELGHIRFN